MHLSWSSMKRLAAVKARHNIERFVIIQRLKCGSFKLNKDDGNAAHAWDYYTPIAGENILIAWAIVCYRLAGPSTTFVFAKHIVANEYLVRLCHCECSQ